MPTLDKANHIRTQRAATKSKARLLLHSAGFSNEDISLVTGLSESAVRIALKRDIERYEKEYGKKFKTYAERRRERSQPQH